MRFILLFCSFNCVIAMRVVEQIAEQQKLFQQKQCPVFAKFNTVLRNPLVTNQKNRMSVAQAMACITPHDHVLFSQRYPSKKKDMNTSLLWGIAQLPNEIQKKIIEYMIDNNENAVKIFMSSPFIYAMDRYSRIIYLKRNYWELYCMNEDLFLRISPYTKTHFVVSDIQKEAAKKCALSLCKIVGIGSICPIGGGVISCCIGCKVSGMGVGFIMGFTGIAGCATCIGLGLNQFSCYDIDRLQQWSKISVPFEELS